MALIIVGWHPFQSPRTPSSAGILFAASKKEVYPLFCAAGSVASA